MKDMQNAKYRKVLESLANECSIRAFGGCEPPDNAQAPLDAQLDMAVKDLAVDRYHQVLDALKRLQGGSYGMCEECAQPIGIARLEIVPEATLCVHCQMHREKKKAILNDVAESPLDQMM